MGLASRRAAWIFLQKFFHQNKAFEILINPNDAGSPLKKLSRNDLSFARAIIMASLRRKTQLEGLIRQFLKKTPPAKTGAEELLLLTAVQILFLDVPAHGAINAATQLAKTHKPAAHLSKLINAVSRRIAEQGPDYIKDHNEPFDLFPAKFAFHYQKLYGQDIIDLWTDVLMRPPPLDLSLKKQGAKEAQKWAEILNGTILNDSQIRIDNLKGPVFQLDGFEEGAWWVQDFAASLPVMGFDDVKNKRVLDVCAAPGGKTAQLCARGAHVTAIDQNEARLERLKENMTRLGFHPALIKADGANFQTDELFDHILLDAPCSATGTLRRHPDIFYRSQNKNWLEQPLAAQRNILNNCQNLIKLGGTLIYCTCSLESEEGEDQIKQFLKDHSAWQIKPFKRNETFLDPNWITNDGFIRLLPHYAPGENTKGMDGFFIARLTYTPS